LEQGTVWITGASSGLGYHTAEALTRKGYLVIAGARSFKPYEGPCADGSHLIPLDVRNPESIRAFKRQALKISPRVDALFNCAGILVLGPCEETGRDEYRGVMETNFHGMTGMVRAALPLMRAQGAGRIVNFSSINGLLGIPFQSAYTASKHAIEGYSECLAMETAPFGIQVCVLEPGDHRGGSGAYRGRAGRASPASPYAAAFRRGTGVIARDEASGLDPRRLGRIAADLLKKRRMPFRKQVAAFDQRLAVVLHTLFPARLIQSILTQYYLGKGDTAHEKNQPNSGAL
jgi:NAD(P)-dependent dehydrogenase (short-subunit alcohol dehydrogenase family)